MTAPTLPAVTDAHRHAAFEAMHWPGWTFAAAMAYDLRRRLIEARAGQIRTREWLASHPPELRTVQRARVCSDGRVAWCTQTVLGAHQAQAEPDLL